MRKVEKGIIKQFLSYRKAKNLMEEICKVKDLFWEVKIIEENDLGRVKKKLVVEIAKTWWNPEKFADLIDLVFKETVKYNLWVHSCYDGYNGDIKLEIEVK